MQQDASNAKQLLVERVRQSTNILVAVNSNPSVDALSAALGLALMLNKMDKHATAVFSGAMPPAMEFLNPNKTFENTVDSLRDFIISLDKEKADRLRYKVEDDVVRIFITPYRTTISEKDLQFSQGDFNVDLILALGVEKRDELDKAIVAHGRILHDATVMTINSNNQQSSLGSVDWHEAAASSLCEMLVSLAEAFQLPGLLDAQIATALLTGIVAATDRFSNEHTSPRVMTMAAQLMAAGANQQLIANNLLKVREQPLSPNGQLVNGAGSIKVATPPVVEEAQQKPDGELDIAHPKEGEKQQPQPPVPPASQQGKGKQGKRKQQPQPQPQPTAEEELEAALPPAPPLVPRPILEELKAQAPSPDEEVPQMLKERKAPGSQGVNGGDEDEDNPPKEEDSYIASNSSWRGRRLEPPALGGTLNATTEEAMDETRKEEEANRNRKLLSHDTVPSEPAAALQPAPPAPKAKKAASVSVPEPQPEPASAPEPEPEPKLAPAPAPEPLPAPPPPPTPPEPSFPPVPPLPVVEPPAQPEPTPEPEPAPQPAPAPEPLPPAPAPLPEPTPLPESPALPAPTSEPAPALAPPVADIDAARQAVNDALSAQPFNPATEPPLQSVGALPLGVGDQPPAPEPLPPAPAPAPALTPEPPAPITSPVTSPAEPPSLSQQPLAPPSPSDVPPLPPLPPMPPLPQDSTQPLPPPPTPSVIDLPPLPDNIPPAPITPPIAPPTEPPAASPPPADPGQFRIPGQPAA